MLTLDRLLVAGIAIAAVALAPMPTANAQKAGQPAAKAAAAAPPAKAVAKKPKRKQKTKTASVCQGLAQSPCERNEVCGWIKPKKKVDKRGRKLTAYCRKVAGIARARKPKAKRKDSAVRKTTAKRTGSKPNKKK